MAIRDRNGNVYRLRGPNPALADQIAWDRSQMRFLNRHWKSEVVTDQRKELPQYHRLDIVKKLEPFEEKTRTVAAREFVAEAAAPVAEQEPQATDVLSRRGVDFFCAPATGRREHTDDLYGTRTYTTEYGSPYVFRVVVVAESDLQIQLWATDPVDSESVIYRRVKEGGERWWRVQRSEPHRGGYLVLANVSDVNPHFGG